MAWGASTRKYTLSAEMFNYLGVSQGALDGVIKGDVTYEYYTDLKQIASLTTVNDNYIFGNLISLTLTSGDGDSENLGYFCVKSVSKKERQGMVLKEYELVSLIYKIQTIQFHTEDTISGTKNVKDATSGYVNGGGFLQYEYDSTYSSTSHTFTDGEIKATRGGTFLELLLKILDVYKWVLKPDGYILKVIPYTNPSKQTSSFTFTLDNGTISGDVEYKDGRYDTFNDIGMWYEKNDISLAAKATNSTDANVGTKVRQQAVEEDSEVDSLNPQTSEQLTKLVNQKLAESIIVHNEYEFDGIYAGLHAGDACTITLSDGTHKCMVKSLKLTIDKAMKCHYTLKDFTNG